MSFVLNFANWKRLYEAEGDMPGATPGGPDKGKNKAPGSPEGWTHPNSGEVYKYPFKDENAYSAYYFFGSKVNSSGQPVWNDQDKKAALIKVSPKLKDEPLKKWDSTYNANIPSYTVKTIIEGVQQMLLGCAKYGLGPVPPQTILDKRKEEFGGAFPPDDAIVYGINNLLDLLTKLNATKEYTGISEDFRTNWPTIWSEQRKAAGLPETMPAVASIVPAKK